MKGMAGLHWVMELRPIVCMWGRKNEATSQIQILIALDEKHVYTYILK